MASISTGQAQGGRRAVDHEIPLIPFIDLLLCCIMFLLVTAVWNQLSAIQVDAPGATPDGPIDGPPPARPLVLQVGAHGYTLVGMAGDQTRVPKHDGAFDVAGLRERLAERHEVAPNERAVVVSADDGVAYADVVLVMDTLVGAGFPDVSVGGAP